MKLKKRILAGLLSLTVLLCSCSGQPSNDSSTQSSSKSAAAQATTVSSESAAAPSEQTTATSEQATASSENTTTTSEQATASSEQTTTSSEQTAPAPGSAAESQSTQTSSQQQNESVQGVPMWEGTAPNGNKILFLGSMHAAKPDFYPIPEKIKTAYEQAEIMAFECDSEGAHSESLQFEQQRKMTCTDGSQLKDKLSPEAYEILCAHLAELGSTEESVADLRPWAAYEMLSMLWMQSSGISTTNGIDYYLLRQTKKDAKQLFELENAQTQLDMVTEQPDKLYDTLLRLTKDETKQTFASENNKLYEAWLTGDIDAIAEISELPSDEELKKYGISSEDLTLIKNRNKIQVDDRNAVMAEGIKKLFASGKKVFVTVGVGHYIGENGLISLLEKDGYTFKRI